MPDRRRALAALTDTFLPGGDGLPSASELGIPDRILAEVEGLGRPALRRELDLLLGVVETPAGGLLLGRQPRPFSRLAHAEREAYLRRLATSPVGLKRTAFQDLKRLTLLLAYGIDDSPYRALTGFRVPVADAPAVGPVTARTPVAGESIEADLCVVGSGPGGSLTAAMAAAAGLRVVILEKAAHVDEQRFGGPELQGLVDLFLDRGLTASDERWLAIRAGSAVGGGSVVNWSSSIRLPENVREEWARTAGIDDLDPQYDAVETVLGVTEAESGRNGPNGVLERGLTAMGLPHQTIPRNVRDCGDCGPCAVGCRRGAKRSALRTYLADAVRDGAEVLDRSDADRILVANGRVTGVQARVPGGTITVRARLVALAAGSIHSPAVLLRSGIARGIAGRTLHLHPVTAVAGVMPEATDPWTGVPQSVMSEAFAHVDGDHGFRLEASPAHPGLIASALPWWSAAQHRDQMALMAHVAPLIAIVRDRTMSRVDLWPDGTPRIRYGDGRPERALLTQAMVELAEVLRAAGATRVLTLHTPLHEWRSGMPWGAYLEGIRSRGVSPNRVLLFTAHQMASCRIGIDPRTSTADPDGQVRGVRGLWVTDSSAFPSASGVNPMLTVYALARRTAGRMLAKAPREVA
jgi:choline dehydrogenase-like flavoprotein